MRLRPRGSWHLTITRLVPPLPGGRWYCALFIFVLLVGAFWACGVFDPQVPDRRSGSAGAALFFSVVLAYTVPVLHYISERTSDAMAALAPSLPADAVHLADLQRRVWCKPRAWFVWVLGIGLASDLAHNLLLFGSASELARSFVAHGHVAAVVVGTWLTWVLITLALAALLDNARLVARLGQAVRVDLLQPHALRPIGSVAVLSTLMVVGAMAAFPVMFLDRELSAMAYVPGLMAMAVPMLLLAALPVWPVHRRLSRAKAEAIADLNRRIEEVVAAASTRTPTVDDEALAALTPLLSYRQELTQVSEWPVDVGVVTRLGIYLVIPPLTWVGAALIEKLLDALL